MVILEPGYLNYWSLSDRRISPVFRRAPASNVALHPGFLSSQYANPFWNHLLINSAKRTRTRTRRCKTCLLRKSWMIIGYFDFEACILCCKVPDVNRCLPCHVDHHLICSFKLKLLQILSCKKVEKIIEAMRIYREDLKEPFRLGELFIAWRGSLKQLQLSHWMNSIVWTG